ncbi:hypothetical protein GCM10010946_33410 [Undibacterium squillarum]|uniref:Transposase n=1 Tax=Undibacterium squillarum TaxID=1131567 RepID=A0ABQ2Y2A0_9BURK|nr:hypothetical protein GCM10010946_33410 [Undibacterium squillarum]
MQEAYREKKIREEQERSLVKIENEEIEASLTKRDKLDYVSFEDFDLSIQLKNFGASKD